MRTYFAVFRMRFIAAFQYRIVAFSSMTTSLVWGFMSILAYAAFYRVNPDAFPMTFPQTVSYVWINQTFLLWFAVVFTDGDIESTLESGSIAYELARPADLYWRWFTRACAGRVAMSVLRLPALAAAFLLPGILKMTLPPDLIRLLLFVLSMVLALFVTVSFTMLMYVTMFHTISFRGIRLTVTAVTTFLSGGLIPLPFFPISIRGIVEVLPFAAMQNIPLRIYNGNITGIDVIYGIGFQVFWLVTLIILGKLAMGYSLRKVVVQGG